MTQIQEIPLTTITGESSSLKEFDGKVVLVVNVASKCGLTPQYEGLVKLQNAYADRGFTVAGFPANNFGGQEPGTESEIVEFCSTRFSVNFPMFSKISVVGEDQHPLYRELTKLAPEAAGDPESFRARLAGFGMTPTQAPDVLWNFEKFLIGRDGTVVGRFAPTTGPDDAALTGAIEAALG